MEEAKYTRLPTDEAVNRPSLRQRARPLQQRDEAAEDLRFRYEIVDRVPWGSILLAVFLLLFGSFFFVIAYLIFTSHIGGERSQAFGFLVIGFLVFLPGFYETRIAYYSWRGCKGYSYSNIPAF